MIERPSVYVLVGVPFVKIGYSEDVARRVAQLRARHPGCRYPEGLAALEPLVLVETWRASIYTEKALHDALEESRAVGDWYHLDERMIRWVNRRREGLFSPARAAVILSGGSPVTWWRTADGRPTGTYLADIEAQRGYPRTPDDADRHARDDQGHRQEG